VTFSLRINSARGPERMCDPSRSRSRCPAIDKRGMRRFCSTRKLVMPSDFQAFDDAEDFLDTGGQAHRGSSRRSAWADPSTRAPCQHSAALRNGLSTVFFSVQYREDSSALYVSRDVRIAARVPRVAGCLSMSHARRPAAARVPAHADPYPLFRSQPLDVPPAQAIVPPDACCPPGRSCQQRRLCRTVGAHERDHWPTFTSRSMPCNALIRP